MKKRVLGVLMASVMTLSLMACGGGGTEADKSEEKTEAASESTEKDETSAASSETLKVGVVAGITGSDPLEGERMKQAVELALEEYNKEDGSISIELDVQDSKGTTDGALNAVQKCISDGCQVIIGPHKSTQAMAVGETVDAAEIPFISGGTSPNLIGKFKYLYTVRTNDKYAAAIGAKACAEFVEAKKVGIFYVSDDYGNGGLSVASEYFDEKGVEYVSEAYNSGDTDVSGQVLSIMNSGADCILLWAHGADMALISRTMNQLGSTIPVVAASGIAVQQYIDLCDNAWIEGWYGVGEYIPTSSSEVVQNYAKNFKEYTGEEGELFGSTYYGAFQAVIQAVANGGGIDSASITEGMKQIQGLQTVLGEYNCDADNNLMHEATLVEMHDGVPEVLEAVSVDY